MEAIASVCASGIVATDVGGTATTTDITQAAVAFIDFRTTVAEAV